MLDKISYPAKTSVKLVEVVDGGQNSDGDSMETSQLQDEEQMR